MAISSQKKANKCNLCKKKMSLTMSNIICDCGKCFCLLHRLPESHN